MSVIVAVPDSASGQAALDAAFAEARNLGTNLIIVPLGLQGINEASFDQGVPHEVRLRKGRGDRDPAQAVLDEIEATPGVQRLVIGMRRRSPMSKMIIGSVSQRLLIESPVPVLAVKP